MSTIDVDILSRESVQRTADIMGPQSAAAQALDCVQRDHAGAAEVCRPVGRNTFIVIPHADLKAGGWSPSTATRHEEN